ncbi:MAG: hypothetical protein RIB32_00465 [Phycisphaerales bacterium]
MTTEPTRNLDDVLDRARHRAWPGPDHNPKVDAFLSEQSMNTQRKSLSKSTILIAIAALVGGGAVTAAVTHQIMAQRAKLVTEDGREFDVMLAPTPDGAAGTFVTDDGTVYGIDMVDGTSERTVNVEMAGPEGGAATGTVPADATGAKFIDEDGVEHEVDPSAIDGWTPDDDG